MLYASRPVSFAVSRDRSESAISSQVFMIMQRDDKLYPAFKKSPHYVRLLAELDLLRDGSNQSTEEANGGDTVSNPVGAYLYEYRINMNAQFRISQTNQHNHWTQNIYFCSKKCSKTSRGNNIASIMSSIMVVD